MSTRSKILSVYKAARRNNRWIEPIRESQQEALDLIEGYLHDDNEQEPDFALKVAYMRGLQDQIDEMAK
jgi:hypothetical protein